MPGKMSPAAEAVAADSLLLDQPKSSAPFSAELAELAAEQHEQVTQKQLRPQKERAPVADAVDEGQVRDRATTERSTVLRPPQGPAAPQAPAAPLAPGAPAAFAGGTDNNTTIPPDTAGAVGPQHVFNPLNNNVWIFNRSGTVVAPVVSLNRFWSGLGVQGDTFDPRAVYDPYDGRYIFATMADATQPTSKLLIAVSTNSDPLQWISHAIQVDNAAQGQVWFDFPSVGFTADKITVQINLFTRAGNQFAGSTIYALDKQSIYNPPHQAPVQRFVLVNKGATHVPAVTYDPAMNDQYLLARWGGNIQGHGYLLVYKLSGNVGLNHATLTQVGFLGTTSTWESFPPNDIGPQSEIPERLSVGDDRLLGVCVRNGRLYCCHSVMLPVGGVTRSAVQWWEIDIANWSVLNVGRIDDPNGAICYSSPSISVNKQNDLLIGHAHFSKTTHPSGAYTLRNSGGQPAPTLVYAPGLNTYFKTFSGTTNRWGDYSHAQVDPSNDRDFWTVQEFAGAQANLWATMWAHIPMAAAATVAVA